MQLFSLMIWLAKFTVKTGPIRDVTDHPLDIWRIFAIRIAKSGPSFGHYNALQIMHMRSCCTVQNSFYIHSSSFIHSVKKYALLTYFSMSSGRESKYRTRGGLLHAPSRPQGRSCAQLYVWYQGNVKKYSDPVLALCIVSWHYQGWTSH